MTTESTSSVGTLPIAGRSGGSASEAVAPIHAGRFRSDVQGLRGVAVLLIVLYHARLPFVDGGYVGVDVFFVISGFVISRLLVAELELTERVDFARFYRRRVRRLLPALSLALAGVCLAGVLLSPIGSQQFTIRTAIAATLLNANTYLSMAGEGGYFDAGTDANALVHTWSLSVEEQFYLLFPALVAGAWAIGRRLGVNPRSSVGVMLGVVGVSMPVAALLTAGVLDPAGLGSEVAFYWAPVRAWEFAAGGVIAIAGSGLVRRLGPFWAVTGGVGMAMIVVAVVAYDANTAFPGLAALVPVAGTMLLISGGETTSLTPVGRLLSWRPLQLAGDLSYSWYLWHWPVIVFAAGLWPTVPAIRALAAVLSLVPAVLSYQLVEKPIRFGWYTRSTLRLGAICVSAAVLAAGAGEIGFRLIDRTGIDEPFAVHADVARGCSNSTPVGERDLGECTWPAPSSGGVAMLVGDSNAGHFSEGFVAAANAFNLDATVATFHGCPFVELDLWNEGRYNEECRRFVSESLAYLAEHPPDLVMIATASDVYLQSESFELRPASGGTVERTPGGKADLYQAALREVVERLRHAGSTVMLVHPTPRLDQRWDPETMSALRLLGAPSAMNVGVDRASALEYRSLAVAAERAALHDAEGGIDLFNELCPARRCVAHDGRRWLYRDWFHITTDQSRELAMVFSRRMTAVLDG